MTIQTIKSDIISVIKEIDNEDILNDLKNHIYEITSDFSEEERVLIEKIRQGISLEIIDRLHMLIQESRERKLNNEEEKESMYLVDITEAASVTRLENMIKLSNVWGVSVTEVMKKLNIKKREPRVLW